MTSSEPANSRLRGQTESHAMARADPSGELLVLAMAGERDAVAELTRALFWLPLLRVSAGPSQRPNPSGMWGG